MKELHDKLEDAKADAQVESVLHDLSCSVNTCAVVFESGIDLDRSAVITLSTEVSDPINPGEMIGRNSVSRLGREQQAKLLAIAKLLAVFDRGPECSLDVPGWMGVVACFMPLVLSWGPRCLHTRGVWERLKSFGDEAAVCPGPRIGWKEKRWKG